MTALYIAGSSRELDRCEAAIAYARSLDLEITCDWVASMRALAASGRLPADRSPEQQRAAIIDLRGIINARVVVLLASAHESEMRVEYGYALRGGTPVVVSRAAGPETYRFFDVVCPYETSTDEGAIVLAKSLAQPQAVEAGR